MMNIYGMQCPQMTCHKNVYQSERILLIPEIKSILAMENEKILVKKLIDRKPNKSMLINLK